MYDLFEEQVVVVFEYSNAEIFCGSLVFAVLVAWTVEKWEPMISSLYSYHLTLILSPWV